MSPLEAIPPEVRQFLDRCIDSIEQLEVLLVLWRNTGTCVDSGAITRELGSTHDSILKRLKSLILIGLAEESDGGFRYRTDPAHDQIVELVARAYRERRVSMITYIINNAGKTLRAFSDAFKLRDPRNP